MANRRWGPGAGGKKVRCSRCGSGNYATDATCLSCGSDLDLARTALTLHHSGESTAARAEPPDPAAPLARKSYRQAPVLLLGSAVFLLLCITVYRLMDESGSQYEIHGVMLAAVPALCAVVSCVTEATGAFEGLWAISPCRSHRAWASVLALSLAILGATLLFAIPDLRNLHTLAVEGRRELVQARITAMRISSRTGAGGATHRLDLEFNVGGCALRGRDWVPGPTFPRPGEETEYIQNQMSKPYRLFVTYLPSNPAIYSFNRVDLTSFARAGMSWGVAFLFLTTGLGLLCYYSRPW